MLMSGAEIQAAGVVHDSANEMFKAASYNIRVGRIVLPGGREATEYQIPPLGMVKAVSLERLTLPKNTLAYATVKTGLSTDGILAINIGLVDPEYRGFLSSILINFSKNDYHLQRGDEFLRLTFHRYRSPAGSVPRPSHMTTEADYVREAKASFVQRFYATFLNIDESTKATLRRELSNIVLRWLPLAAFLLVGFTFLLNFGNAWLAQRSLRQPQVERDIEQIRSNSSKDAEQLRGRIAELEKQLRAFEDSVERGKGGNSGGAGRRTR